MNNKRDTKPDYKMKRRFEMVSGLKEVRNDTHRGKSNHREI